MTMSIILPFVFVFCINFEYTKNDRSLRFQYKQFSFLFYVFVSTMASWVHSSRISHLRALRKSVLAHLIALLAAEQCELTMDALKAQPLAEVARNVASDVFRENFDAVASPHHRTRNGESMFARSRHRRIERTMSLWKV